MSILWPVHVIKRKRDLSIKTEPIKLDGRISRSVVPPKGWRYKQGSYWIYGDTWKDLIETLKLHRKNNGLPIGDIEKEVEDQLCKLNPSIIINK